MKLSIILNAIVGAVAITIGATLLFQFSPGYIDALKSLVSLQSTNTCMHTLSFPTFYALQTNIAKPARPTFTKRLQTPTRTRALTVMDICGPDGWWSWVNRMSSLGVGD
jgi:hypothetical protein